MPEKLPNPKRSDRAYKKMGVKFGWVLLVIIITSCTLGPPLEVLPTLIPEEELPTVIALTSEAIASQTAEALPSITNTASPVPTKTIIPTTAGPSPTATRTARPSRTPTITDTSPPSNTPTITLTPTPTHTPSITPTPTPVYTATPEPPEEIPFSAVQIVHPSHLSKVVSPIELYTFVAPGGDGRIRVELKGEDGRLLYRQVFLFTETPAGAHVNLNAKVAFEIAGVAETGRLTVSVNDEYERLKSYPL